MASTDSINQYVDIMAEMHKKSMSMMNNFMSSTSTANCIIVNEILNKANNLFTKYFLYLVIFLLVLISAIYVWFNNYYKPLLIEEIRHEIAIELNKNKKKVSFK